MINMKIKNNFQKITQNFAFLCFLILLFSSLTGSANNKDIQTKNFSNLSLTPHEAIFINNDNNFTDYGFSGVGSENSPYIIENLNITTTIEYGIEIVNTTKHFVIRNCYVDAFQRGIKIINSSDYTATIRNNICPNNNFAGIHIEDSNYVIVSNNTCTDTLAEGGIAIFDSSYVNVTDNICTKTKQNYGIYIYKSHNCLLTGNIIKECRLYGIYISSESSSCVIHHNSIIDNNLDGTSQAWDSSTDSIWYEELLQEGNYWNEWKKKSPYSIDGWAETEDKYPLDESLERASLSFSLAFTAIFLYAICFRKRSKMKF